MKQERNREDFIFMSPIEYENIFKRPSRVEPVGPVLVGRIELSLLKTPPAPSPEIQILLLCLSEDEPLRRAIASQMSNNSPCTTINLERGASAYFTFDPTRNKLTVEWGRIPPGNGKAKLHDYLNEVIDFSPRRRNGMIARSGHLSAINPNGEECLPIILIDSLHRETCPVAINRPEYKMVTTIWQHGGAVIGSDGSIALTKYMAQETHS